MIVWMMNSPSCYQNNDEMITDFVAKRYIESSHLESIFRAVNIGDFVAPKSLNAVYPKAGMQFGHLITFPPATYAMAMKSLDLKPGMSLLVLGSGGGYLNVLAGLCLGPYGINHGIEVHEDVVEFAKIKTKHFLENSPAVDRYEFCFPEFVSGNCLLLSNNGPRITYDRVYVSDIFHLEGSCKFIESLVGNGSVVVFNGSYLVEKYIITDVNFTFENENTFKFECVGDIPFVPDFYLCPNKKDDLLIRLPERNPLTLKDLSRSTIRVLLKAEIEAENPFIKNMKHVDCEENSSKTQSSKPSSNEAQNCKIDYTNFMKEKIRKLFLPESLKIFLNLDRLF